ncbi:MAG: hypothetical protein PHX20_05525 [Candidatus Omnitrophica bacterium]|nr:hypothetical protein [Candidatus Omnitrophota bacterium]
MMTDNQKRELTEEYILAVSDVRNLISETATFCQSLKHAKAIDHCRHGLARRMFLLTRCLEQFLNISPPQRTEHLKMVEKYDLDIFLHAFLMNISGGINNLAWILFYEKGVCEKEDEKRFKKNINLFNKEFQRYLNETIIKKCDDYKDWHKNLTNFRDPIAHRIPPYIIPSIMNDAETEKHRKLWDDFLKTKDLDKRNSILNDMDKIGVYEPIYTHSYVEKSDIIFFHPRNISDIKIFKDISETVINNF